MACYTLNLGNLSTSTYESYAYDTHKTYYIAECPNPWQLEMITDDPVKFAEEFGTAADKYGKHWGGSKGIIDGANCWIALCEQCDIPLGITYNDVKSHLLYLNSLYTKNYRKITLSFPVCTEPSCFMCNCRENTCSFFTNYSSNIDVDDLKSLTYSQLKVKYPGLDIKFPTNDHEYSESEYILCCCTRTTLEC